jgi:hypothetical protein
MLPQIYLDHNHHRNSIQPLPSAHFNSCFTTLCLHHHKPSHRSPLSSHSTSLIITKTTVWPDNQYSPFHQHKSPEQSQRSPQPAPKSPVITVATIASVTAKNIDRKCRKVLHVQVAYGCSPAARRTPYSLLSVILRDWWQHCQGKGGAPCELTITRTW